MFRKLGNADRIGFTAALLASWAAEDVPAEDPAEDPQAASVKVIIAARIMDTVLFFIILSSFCAANEASSCPEDGRKAFYQRKAKRHFL
jgi:hypothetical protein